MTKAVVIVLSDEVADDVARLLHGALTINGYRVEGPPTVIDWPVPERAESVQPAEPARP